MVPVIYRFQIFVYITETLPTVKDVLAMAKLFDVQEGSLFQIILSSVKLQPTVRWETK